MINNFVASIRKKSEQKEEAKSPLNFVIENFSYAVQKDSASQTPSGRFIMHKNSYFYIIGNYGFSSKDLDLMAIVKAQVINLLSSNFSMHEEPSIEDSRKIAFAKLSEFTNTANADYLSYFVAHDTAGSGPFSILMEDKLGIEEIEVNAPCSPITIYSSEYGRCQTNIRFTGEPAFRHSVNKLILKSEKELNEDFPIIDAQISESRVHAQMHPYASSGGVASIRIGKGKRISFNSMLSMGTMDIETIAYLWIAIDAGMNIIISGSPASGKTTMLGSLSRLIPQTYKSVIIEEEIDELDINYGIQNTVSLRGKNDGISNTRSQMINALRMRPDWMIVGEIRGEETKDLFAGANIGIPFLTTMHSNSDGFSAIKKLMVRPMSVEPGSISMLDACIYMRQNGINSRIISSIMEYMWLSKAEIEDGTPLGNGDSVEGRVICSEGRTSRNTIAASKALFRFSSKNKIPISAAKSEIAKRIAFLKERYSKPEQNDIIASISEYRYGVVHE